MVFSRVRAGAGGFIFAPGMVLSGKTRKGAASWIPRTPHTTNKTIRFPDDVIADVEAAIAGKNCTFSAFVIAAVRSALAQLAESTEA